MHATGLFSRRQRGFDPSRRAVTALPCPLGERALVARSQSIDGRTNEGVERSVDDRGSAPPPSSSVRAPSRALARVAAARRWRAAVLSSSVVYSNRARAPRRRRHAVLAHEPKNAMVREYEKALTAYVAKGLDATESKDDSDDDDDDDDDDGGDAKGGGDEKSDDSDDDDESDEEEEPDLRTAAEKEAATMAELREDMDSFGIAGTPQELSSTLKCVRHITIVVASPLLLYLPALRGESERKRVKNRSRRATKQPHQHHVLLPTERRIGSDARQNDHTNTTTSLPALAGTSRSSATGRRPARRRRRRSRRSRRAPTSSPPTSAAPRHRRRRPSGGRGGRRRRRRRRRAAGRPAAAVAAAASPA